MTLTDDQIIDELDKMEREAKAYKDEALRICWYMRGSISYEDSMLLSNADREIINKLIKYNMETTEKTGLPFF